MEEDRVEDEAGQLGQPLGSLVKRAVRHLLLRPPGYEPDAGNELKTI